jgi:eukaryotic-like serine/threonine-protein kinase
MLAKSLQRDKDRAAFMARKTELMKSRLKVAVPQPAGPLSSAVNPVSPLGITPEAIDHAARMLAAHVGPISGVLAKKAARKADSLQSLYRLLSEHVQNSKERRQFLRDVGFPET